MTWLEAWSRAAWGAGGGLGVALAFSGLVLGSGPAARAANAEDAEDAEDEWELVLREDFSRPDAVRDWILEGRAEVTITAEGELLVHTANVLTGEALRAGRVRGASMLWYPKPTWGDLCFEFDGRAETNSPAICHDILYFSARVLANVVALLSATCP